MVLCTVSPQILVPSSCFYLIRLILTVNQNVRIRTNFPSKRDGDVVKFTSTQEAEMHDILLMHDNIIIPEGLLCSVCDKKNVCVNLCLDPMMMIYNAPIWMICITRIIYVRSSKTLSFRPFGLLWCVCKGVFCFFCFVLLR